MAAKVSEALANEKQPKARDWLLKSGFNSSKALEVVGPWTFGVDGDVGLAEVEDCSSGGPGAIRKKSIKIRLENYTDLSPAGAASFGQIWPKLGKSFQCSPIFFEHFFF